jgi:predicted ATPase
VSAMVVRRVSSPVFVGRSSELAALDAVLARAGKGDGSAVLVEGEAGIGKSRLMARLESRGRAAGLAVLVGECLPLAEGELAFAPIVAALRSVMLDLEMLVGLEPALRTALAALWPMAGSEPHRPSDREQLFEAVYRVLAGLAARQPALLIVEDVHWADPSSRDLLSFVVHNARRDRLVVVATYRPDELRRGHPLRRFVAVQGLLQDVGEQVGSVKCRFAAAAYADRCARSRRSG